MEGDSIDRMLCQNLEMATVAAAEEGAHIIPFPVVRKSVDIEYVSPLPPAKFYDWADPESDLLPTPYDWAVESPEMAD